MENQLNIGQFVAAEILVLFIVDSVEKLILLHETGYDVLTATEKIGQVTDLPIEREGGIRVEEFSDKKPLEVELRNLSYQYDDAESPVLKDLTLTIRAGERLAIAGYNGSGKSTLMQILSVARRDFTGSLLFNGLPKRNLDLRSLREHIGDYSSQEDVFMGTILENITLGRSSISLQRVLEVCESIGLSEFIQHCPQGIDTELQPGGKNMPRSIIAKLLVARAVVSDPNLLVMEEPLGNLNFRDRLRISQMLTDQTHAWTFVAITEDPLLASLCDRVVVLKDGQFIFDGTFKAVQKTEHYERIFRENE
jgi:ABC-type bacteriocin/lantibiotic exporter with double-glycine peptidase domain